MSKIYLVRAFGGQYDDAFESIIKAWSTKSLANDHIETLENEDKLKIEYSSKIIKDLEKFALALPKVKVRELNIIPKWESGFSLEEYNALRIKLEKDNKVIVFKNERAHYDQDKLIEEYRLKLIESYKLDEEVSNYLTTCHEEFKQFSVNYDIDEIDLD